MYGHKKYLGISAFRKFMNIGYLSHTKGRDYRQDATEQHQPATLQPTMTTTTTGNVPYALIVEEQREIIPMK